MNKDVDFILNSLRDKMIFITDVKQLKSNFNYELLSREDFIIFEILINSKFLWDYPYPVVIDIKKAIGLIKNDNHNIINKIPNIISLSRFSFMGTDGLRGKTTASSTLDPIKALLSDNLLTPELIELLSFSFSKMLMKSGIVELNDIACVGNDGRDLTTNWTFNIAMISGFKKAGLNILDVGSVPTPFVPYKMLKESFNAGAVLTASHNPSNQNGIKYFTKGKKNLPEGKTGDYCLSAWIVHTYIGGMNSSYSTISKELDIEDEVLDFMIDILPQDITTDIGSTLVLLDSANGAYFSLSKKVMERLGISYISTDKIPDGFNINRSCGVAEIEGREEFLPADYDAAIPIIRLLFDSGRKSNINVMGIVLDGDGDRGFVLTYDKTEDRVLVLDGDKCGYILAMYYKKQGIEFSGKNFITTVESDIMTAFSAKEYLGINAPIVSVGDKWIGSFDGGELLLGLESSGHLILPLKFKNRKSEMVELRSGNGLLTTLLTILAIKKLNISAIESFTPYKNGFSKTFYTYFVDKTLFYPGSDLWDIDKKIINNEFSKLKTDLKLVFEIKQDPHMLYASIMDVNKVVGSIFCRNSGTEDKIAVYVKCQNSLKDDLVNIALKIRDIHIDKMKNSSRREYKQEIVLIDALKKESNLSISSLNKILEWEFSETIHESDLYNLIYGLKKEGRVTVENSLVNII